MASMVHHLSEFVAPHDIKKSTTRPRGNVGAQVQRTVGHPRTKLTISQHYSKSIPGQFDPFRVGMSANTSTASNADFGSKLLEPPSKQNTHDFHTGPITQLESIPTIEVKSMSVTWLPQAQDKREPSQFLGKLSFTLIFYVAQTPMNLTPKSFESKGKTEIRGASSNTASMTGRTQKTGCRDAAMLTPESIKKRVMRHWRYGTQGA
ncbi:hypothetical protein B0H16DRAFT_1451361 [Mycena metata]|uniref:Uncharacterized protein n=1 Tax=Mycena metata TaxID=1033252 RepID=A0AAD7JUM6_9AGAR|nr:hypothetical protein B0H16DRAFT_1451361 [Mycena metata]